ncbi:hypothetical protein [Xylanimonas protaetiae]|uniref:Uncharacterized protein n=1 Tax=Xylanimonas protaetiae TaxID=2509457 RepID=A0A4P6FLV7_9MICO|nr:hypothetical protein [Xylanimonas protaetiae]QAY71628.1 hypothetical protein ET471_17615 [Xylanimonas protaetiae]
MSQLIATFAVIEAFLHQKFADDDPERGNVTIEHVLWALGVIAIAGIVVYAITNYVTGKAAGIQ